MEGRPNGSKEERRLPGDIVAKPLGKFVSGCFKHGKMVILIVVVITLFLSLGLRNLSFSVDPTDFLPAEDPDTQALKRMLQKTTGLESMELIITKLDYEKSVRYGVYNVTDATAVRAADELWRYIKEKVPEVNEMNGLMAHIYSYLNYANHANNPAYYKLPETDAEMEFMGIFVWGIVGQIIAQLGPYLMTPEGYLDWFILPVGYTPAEKEPGEVISLKNVEIGHDIGKAVEEYTKDCEAGKIEYDMFDFDYIKPIGLGTSMYRMTDVVMDYAVKLGPAVIIFILICLYLAFRNPQTIFIGLISLMIAFVWTLGFMGWMDIKVAPFNIAFLPLVLGNGIDYSLHVLNEWFEHKSTGLGDEEAYVKVGSRAGVAMLLATIDTNIGLLAMTLCGMVALASMGIVSAFAMVCVLMLSLSFIPALTSISKRARKASVRFKPSKFMEKVARGVRKHRIATLSVFAVVSCILFLNIGNLEYMTDPISDLYPEEDYFMQDYRFFMDKIAPQMGRPDDTVTAEVLILEGDLTNPETVDYIHALEDELRKNPRSISSLTVGVLGYHWYLGLYESERYGNAGTVLALVDSFISGYPIEGLCPMTREGIETSLQNCKEDPFWSPWLIMFISQDDTISFLPVIYMAGYGWSESRAVKSEISHAIEKVDVKKPDGVEVYVEGLRTSTYNFMAVTVTWSWILMAAAFLVSLLLMYLFTRRLRAVLAIALPMLFSIMWWMGIIPLFGIKMNPGLLIPMIFITSIAPDYADHLIWNSYKTGSVERSFSTAGKAIMFSALTDFGAFYIFSFMYIKAFVAQPMLAVAICVVIMFILTTVLIPALLTDKELERGVKK